MRSPPFRAALMRSCGDQGAVATVLVLGISSASRFKFKRSFKIANIVIVWSPVPAFAYEIPSASIVCMETRLLNRMIVNIERYRSLLGVQQAAKIIEDCLDRPDINYVSIVGQRSAAIVVFRRHRRFDRIFGGAR
jgi:hypothetical protein